MELNIYVYVYIFSMSSCRGGTAGPDSSSVTCGGDTHVRDASPIIFPAAKVRNIRCICNTQT